MDIKGAPTDRHLRTLARWGRGRQRDLILDRLHMVGEQHFRAVDAVQLEQAFDKIGLTAHQEAGRDPRHRAKVAPIDVLAVDRTLRRH